jgi:hypothetical protein
VTVRTLFAALLFLAPLPAAAQQPASQQAAWAQDRRQPFCVYDGLLATEGGIQAADPARAELVIAQCRARFGWTEAQGGQGVGLALAMIEARNSTADATEAGVEPRIIQEVYDSFSGDEVVRMRMEGGEMSESGRRTGVLIGLRLTERGLQGEQRDKAARAVINRLLAARLFIEFAVGLNFHPDN